MACAPRCYINPNSPNQILLQDEFFDFSPYPDFPTGFIYTSFAGNSYYHSLQLNYERQFSAGFQASCELHVVQVRTELQTCS